VRAVAFAGDNRVIIDLVERINGGKKTISTIRTLDLNTAAITILVKEERKKTFLIGAGDKGAVFARPNGVRQMVLDSQTIPD